jgi:hypothetical protein
MVRLRSETDGKWQTPPATTPTGYLLPVVEFVEFELPAGRVFNRAEWRAACDKGRTREGIIRAAQ